MVQVGQLLYIVIMLGFGRCSMLVKNHFDDCPYGCDDNGTILDVQLRQRVPCPHCSKKKKELLAQGYVESVETDERVSLATLLGIENEFLSTSFVYDAVIPDGERLFIEDESLEWQGEIANDLYLGLTIGNKPTESLCFGLSIKGRLERFVYPMLAKAYLAGLSIGKFMSCSEYSRYSFSIDNSLDDFFNADVLFMLLDEGCTMADLASAKGLMQTRALKGKATIFVTTWTVEACSVLLGYKEDTDKSLAKPVFVKYKSSKGKKQSSYINKLLGVSNESVVENEDVFAKTTMSDLMGMN